MTFKRNGLILTIQYSVKEVNPSVANKADCTTVASLVVYAACWDCMGCLKGP